MGEICFVSKTFLLMSFSKSCYNITPIIFWLLYKKISFLELYEEIFTNGTVFTHFSFVSKSPTVFGAQKFFLPQMFTIIKKVPQPRWLLCRYVNQKVSVH